MPFDKNLVEAQLSYGSIDAAHIPQLACDALEAGLDGPSIRRLSALNAPSAWETDRFLPTAMQEMGLQKIEKKTAALRLAQRLARRILESEKDPLLQLGPFATFWREADYCGELSAVATIEDETYWRTEEAALRRDALIALRDLSELQVD